MQPSWLMDRTPALTCVPPLKLLLAVRASVPAPVLISLATPLLLLSTPLMVAVIASTSTVRETVVLLLTRLIGFTNVRSLFASGVFSTRVVG